jgi:hypothetical protein
MPSIVEQVDRCGCAIAALAMYMQRDYQEVRDACLREVCDRDFSVKGLYTAEIIKLAALFGFKLKEKKSKPKGRAILVVVYPYSLHAVYYDGMNAFDPEYQNNTTHGYLKNTMCHLTERL